jgi:hypothetical protein
MTCDCTRPFSVTIQCVDADMPTNIPNSTVKIVHFIDTIFSLLLAVTARSFQGSYPLEFLHIHTTDGSIMNNKRYIFVPITRLEM